MNYKNVEPSNFFRSCRTRLFLTFFVATLLPLIMVMQAHARGTPDSFADLVEKVLPGVVNINVTKTVSDQDPKIEEFFKRFAPEGAQPEPPRQRSGGGTGFIIDPSGVIVTNNHVVEDADEITVKLNDGEEYAAELVGADPKTDIAVIRINAGKKLPALSFGNSDASRVGDWVLTIGSPFGLGGSVTAGIISAYNRDINTGLYDDYIQTDAPINPGNSGGPMFNLDGQVIGINTAIFSPSGGNNGIGFAIPSSLARHIVDQLRTKGVVQRGWLGVAFQPITNDLAESLGLSDVHGVLVASVNQNSPAGKAGLQSGDVIVKYNNVTLDERHRLPGLVADTPIGKKVTVVALRKGNRKTMSVTIVERTKEREAGLNTAPAKSPKASPTGMVVLGMTLEPLTAELRQHQEIGKSVNGVAIVDIDRNSPARAKGLAPGDVIVAVAQEDVSRPRDVADRVKAARKSGLTYVLVRIYRGGSYTHVALSLENK